MMSLVTATIVSALVAYPIASVLLELLQARASKFFHQNFWVESWLKEQDEFLVALSQTIPAPNARFNPARMPPGVFPRPWPIGAQRGSTLDSKA